MISAPNAPTQRTSGARPCDPRAVVPGGGRGRLWNAGRAVAATLLLGLVVLVAPSVPSASADVGWSVAVAPTEALHDGRPVTINVKTSAAQPVYSVQARVCRPGVAYSTNAGAQPAADFQPSGGNCPGVPLSSSADLVAVASNTFASTQEPGGATISLRVGVGVAAWATDAGTSSLTCDSEHPCSLVVQLLTGPAGEAPAWVPFVQELRYQSDDPIAGCGGAAAGVLSSGGSDRFTGAWVDLTLAICASGNVVGAPSRASFTSEGDSVDQFASGLIDLAYTGVGYRADAGLVRTEDGDPPSREAVAVPLAANAVVVAIGNGKPGPNGGKVPYTDIKLTLDEVTALVSGGRYGMDAYLPAILARNPELAQTSFFETNSEIVTAAMAPPDSTSWFLTRHLEELRPQLWTVPSLNAFGPDAGRPRGVDASLATADPSYNNALTLVSGRPALDRALNNLVGGTSYGGVWIVTDLASARSMGLTPVQIQNDAGQFVAPTDESLAAAIPTMTKAADGTRVPDPHATGGGGVAPYPLTFIEHALAPAEALVDPLCAPRTASQELMKRWLTYVTGPGQAELPAGYLSLTPELKAEAIAAIAAIGATPSTLECPDVPEVEPPTDDGTGGPVVEGFGDLGGSGDLPDFDLPLDVADLGPIGDIAAEALASDSVADDAIAPEPAAEVAAPTATEGVTEVVTVAAVESPGFGGLRGTSAVVTTLALVFTIGLVAGAAMVSKRGRPAGGELGGGAP